MVFGDRILFNLGRNLHAKVSSVINSGTWSWPRGRSSGMQEIMQATPNPFVPRQERDDCFIWSAMPSGVFTSKFAWLVIKEDLPFVAWSKVIWFKGHVPHWTFIEWLVCHGRLNTKD